MCNHILTKMNDICVCAKCGMTVANGKKVLFDRSLTNYIKNKNKKNRRKTK